MSTREIKFRAWDKKHQTFELIGVGTTFPHDVYAGFGKIHQTLTITRPESNLVWQQFTGLLDKNGVEVYEGDIIASADTVESSHRYGRNLAVRYENDGARFTVGYNYKTSLTKDTVRRHHIIVIGNIYENKDLLK